MKRIQSVLLGVLILVLVGCKYMGPNAFLKKTKTDSFADRLENPQLAKLILSPKREKLRVSRDPFKPLLAPTRPSLKPPAPPRQDLKVIYIGTLKVGDEVRALLQVNNKKEFFRKNDVIHGYTIESIDMDNVVLSKGDHQMIIKRSEVK